jgi:hypothetical protein
MCDTLYIGAAFAFHKANGLKECLPVFPNSQPTGVVAADVGFE